MSVCYNNLWKILIDGGNEQNGLNQSLQSYYKCDGKVGGNEDVRAEVLVKIRKILHCTLGGILSDE